MKTKEGNAGSDQEAEWWDSWVPHNISNRELLAILNFSTILKISDKQIKDHQDAYKNILRNPVYKDEESGQEITFYEPGTYIENQRQWKTVPFGNVNMAYAGCEIIAVYNARLSLGESMSGEKMAELICEFEGNGAVIYGQWGVAPTAIYNYFQSNGYNVGMTTSMEIADIIKMGETYDTIIITSYNNQDRITKMIHTVNISKEAGAYVCHNGYKMDNGIYVKEELGDNLWEAVTKLSGGEAKPICIIGIDKKAHEEEDDEEENNK